jgi:hypothetical protein
MDTTEFKNYYLSGLRKPLQNMEMLQRANYED